MKIDLLAALAEINGGRLPEPSKPVHPQTGCLCEDCFRRDGILEDIAIDRAQGY